MLKRLSFFQPDITHSGPLTRALIGPSRVGMNGSLVVYTDGAIRLDAGVSGLAVVVRDPRERILAAWVGQTGRLSCNEAEYAAALLALRVLQPFNPQSVRIRSDSRIVVDQMRGTASAHAPALKTAHAEILLLAVRFRSLTFEHIPREKNRLADALAWEAAEAELLVRTGAR